MDQKKNWKKNIILFLSGQIISLFGSSLVQYAIMWYITLTTKSGVMMTISIIVGFLPNFFLAPFAGVWADRYPRKRLIILADSAIAIATLIAAIVFALGYDSIWTLFAVLAIRSLGQGIQSPAVGAILPQIVPEDKLTKINGMNGSVQALITLFSPMVSAALLSRVPMNAIFMIDVVTAAVAVLILLLIRIPTHAKAMERSEIKYLDDFKEGVRYIKDHPYVKAFFLFCGFFFVLVAPAAFLSPLQVTRSFGEEVWRLSTIEITFSIGMIFGGVLMASWGGFKNKIYTMTLASIIMSAATIALGIVPVFWIYAVLMGVFGLAMPLLNTPSIVLLQEKVEENYLGRVFGVMGMISSSMMPLGMLIFGPLSDLISIESILIGTGIAMLISCFYLLRIKRLVSEDLK